MPVDTEVVVAIPVGGLALQQAESQPTEPQCSGVFSCLAQTGRIIVSSDPSTASSWESGRVYGIWWGISHGPSLQFVMKTEVISTTLTCQEEKK